MAGKPRIKKLTREQLRTLMGGRGRGARFLRGGKCNNEHCDTECTAVVSCHQTCERDPAVPASQVIVKRLRY